MRFLCLTKQKVDPEKWHQRFALWPRRVNDKTIIWLEWYWCRVQTVAEGNWAGGYRWRYQYSDRGLVWNGPVKGD